MPRARGFDQQVVEVDALGSVVYGVDRVEGPLQAHVAAGKAAEIDQDGVPAPGAKPTHGGLRPHNCLILPFDHAHLEGVEVEEGLDIEEEPEAQCHGPAIERQA